MCPRPLTTSPARSEKNRWVSIQLSAKGSVLDRTARRQPIGAPTTTCWLSNPLAGRPSSQRRGRRSAYPVAADAGSEGTPMGQHAHVQMNAGSPPPLLGSPPPRPSDPAPPVTSAPTYPDRGATHAQVMPVFVTLFLALQGVRRLIP